MESEIVGIEVQSSFYIYALRDPESQQIGYLGVTSNLSVRKSDHWQKRRKGTDAKSEWLRGLDQRQQRPEFVVLEVTTEQERFAVEDRWIARLLAEGHPLTNAKMGRPPRPEKKYVLRSFRFPPELWERLEAIAPPKGRSAIIHEGLRRELGRRERQQRRVNEQG